ncbi:hypothetical protein NLJ89_g6963 [Agrocybe chaxingu]|uniref:F-box domain-containing protein n=1 Tax=Agrocybe chaxingu TaxID=84603 RepID=A0A9W8K5E9_9AGAR|nr:hypothetical protein NLJ89_g6963 [Agrocybe chaxingu]
MTHLPTELWLRIAYFVPDIDLFRLASVNHLFHDLVTDRRYRQLVIDDDRPLHLIHKLTRIERDPSVAARVQSLTIHPKAVRSACLRSSRNTWVIRPVRNAHWPDAFRLRTERFAIEEDIELADRFLDAVAKLDRIEEYIIEWRQGVEAERTFCLPLLTAVWPLHSQNLRTIKLDMMLSHLCDMLSTVSGLDRLRDLSLRFTCNDSRFGPWGGPGYEAKYAFEQLATFMNRLALTLQSLAIYSIGHLNFSWLFASLTFFPKMKSLSLQVPCDPRHVIDPTGLHHFLRAHHAVEHFNFAPQYCCHQSTQDPDPAISHGCASTEDWLNRAFGGLSFEGLESLELGLNILGSGGKRVMPPVPRIGGAAKSVRSLGIVGCLISLQDLKAVLDPFKMANPRTLVIEVHVLDINLLDLLASSLPDLERIDLTYRWVGSSGCTDEVRLPVP